MKSMIHYFFSFLGRIVKPGKARCVTPEQKTYCLTPEQMLVIKWWETPWFRNWPRAAGLEHF